MLYRRAASGMRNRSANRHPAKQGKFRITTDTCNPSCVMHVFDARKCQ